MTGCPRCVYVYGLKTCRVVNGLCNWCHNLGREDDRKRKVKGMKYWDKWDA